MRVKLAYGKEGLWVDLPDHNVTIVEPQYVPGLPDEAEAIRAALRSPIGSEPLRELVRATDTVAIVFSDVTRPQPRDRMLPPLLDELAHVPPDQVILINGLGTHRPNTQDELVSMLGRDIVSRYRVIQHNPLDDDQMLRVGRTSFGHDAYVNAEYLRANVRILTGFIEPHFFAGFSGGPKAVLPGIANQQLILANHNAEMVEAPQATWGITKGNPIWEEMLEVALMTRPTFLLNVSLNRDKQITGVFAGDMQEAHAKGTSFVGSTAMVAVAEPFDIVITSNSGFPLDLNVYQAVKGMSAAAQVVKPGGSIIVAAECWDGIPAHGEYGQLLRIAESPEELLAMVKTWTTVRQDQWQVQIQAQIQMRADVYLKNSHLDDRTVRAAKLEPCRHIEETLEKLLQRYGPNATICVLPEGPMTIPYLAETRGQ
ncbi:MAG: nickel-dependent lactate racemase [Chloroflexota bacterium]